MAQKAKAMISISVSCSQPQMTLYELAVNAAAGGEQLLPMLSPSPQQMPKNKGVGIAPANTQMAAIASVNTTVQALASAGAVDVVAITSVNASITPLNFQRSI
jgi:hypothetical protein